MHPVRRYIEKAARRVIVNDKERQRRLSICNGCEHAVLTARGACNDCGKVQTLTGKTDAELACKTCGGTVEPREGVKFDGELPRCGHCGCPLASRTKFKQSHCPIGKW